MRCTLSAGTRVRDDPWAGPAAVTRRDASRPPGHLGPGRVGRAARQRDVTRPKSLPHSGLRSPLLSCVAHGMYVAALTFFFRSFLLSTYSSADENMSLFPSSARSTPTCPVPAAAARVPPHHRRPLPEGVAIRRFLLHQHNIVITILVVTHREAAPLVQLRPTKGIFACRCRIWSSIYVRSLQESKAHMW